MLTECRAVQKCANIIYLEKCSYHNEYVTAEERAIQSLLQVSCTLHVHYLRLLIRRPEPVSLIASLRQTVRETDPSS